MGVKLIAASTDSREQTQQMVEEHGFEFPIAYGVTQADIAALGAFSGERRGDTIMQATEFILNPAGEVAASMYSTTQLGRMNPREVAQFIKARMD